MKHRHKENLNIYIRAINSGEYSIKNGRPTTNEAIAFWKDKFVTFKSSGYLASIHKLYECHKVLGPDLDIGHSLSASVARNRHLVKLKSKQESKQESAKLKECSTIQTKARIKDMISKIKKLEHNSYSEAKILDNNDFYRINLTNCNIDKISDYLYSEEYISLYEYLNKVNTGETGETIIEHYLNSTDRGRYERVTSNSEFCKDFYDTKEKKYIEVKTIAGKTMYVGEDFLNKLKKQSVEFQKNLTIIFLLIPTYGCYERELIYIKINAYDLINQKEIKGKADDHICTLFYTEVLQKKNKTPLKDGCIKLDQRFFAMDKFYRTPIIDELIEKYRETKKNICMYKNSLKNKYRKVEIKKVEDKLKQCDDIKKLKNIYPNNIVNIRIEIEENKYGPNLFSTNNPLSKSSIEASRN